MKLVKSPMGPETVALVRVALEKVPPSVRLETIDEVCSESRLDCLEIEGRVSVVRICSLMMVVLKIGWISLIRVLMYFWSSDCKSSLREARLREGVVWVRARACPPLAGPSGDDRRGGVGVEGVGAGGVPNGEALFTGDRVTVLGGGDTRGGVVRVDEVKKILRRAKLRRLE